MTVGRCHVAWHTEVNGSSVLSREQIFTPPQFIGVVNANSVYGGVDKSVPDLSWEHVVKLDAPLVVLSVGGDLDSSNVRAKMEMWRRAEDRRDCSNFERSFTGDPPFLERGRIGENA